MAAMKLGSAGGGGGGDPRGPSKVVGCMRRVFGKKSYEIGPVAAQKAARRACILRTPGLVRWCRLASLGLLLEQPVF